MDFFEKIQEHEQVVVCHDEATGLKAIIAIHHTAMGPATGGCRMFPYSSFTEALEDVLRLSKGMTYKCAAADVDFGGGKAVIIGDPKKDKSPALFRAFGQFVASLGGRFYTGTDMGTTPEDFVHAMKETNYIVGVPEEYGGSGDSSIPTAQGVIYGMMATNSILNGSQKLGNSSFAIQGIGKVGFKIAELLLREGAQLYVADKNERVIDAIQSRAKEIGNDSLKVISEHDIYRVPVDMFVPCAIGGIIHPETINLLKARAVIGSANNQLRHDDHCYDLQKKNILYAPDYIVNAGGLIQVSDELYGANKERVLRKTKAIYHTLLEVYRVSENENISTLEAANRTCEEKINKSKQRNSFFLREKRPKWVFKH
ncbi:Glu/Leu/Phe/Val dehydrogenase dimerization domain-containing protein [Bacillus chungangensis]|uniref:Phenylalanine dehydrogenase n=1 Tax=Bacillus chungangensis TaxID=587633 RepID=A0ABT9WNH2_9BACI|nr:Glu/Leu/Phe/Val dehydrogenase dimerization domain-containing protein [Bacillus chungangensis]MDQ0174755.1 phenylalanine dehydrogenase [Bacillus chungangensis]